MAMLFYPIEAYRMTSMLMTHRAFRDAAGWSFVTGVVTSAGVKMISREGTDTFEPKVEYRYRVGDTDYVGGIIRPGLSEFGSQTKPAALIAAYPVGADVKVFYDPKDPSESALDTSWKGWGYHVGGLIVSLAIPLFCALCVWVWYLIFP